MTIYKKLMQARIALQNKPLKKSGHNKYAGYHYFELGDFLSEVQQIFNELNMCSYITFTSDTATLTICDSEKPEEKICFQSPMAEANLKGTHPIQNLGAVETYQRRYLYVTALEIVEHDALDATTGQDAPKAAKAVTVDVFDSMGKEDQETIETIATEARWMIEKGDVEGAVKYINDCELDADFKTALWSRFDSKQRSALKKASVK